MSDPTIPVLTLPREMILASAGSGKTFRISSRIIGLLAHGEPPESILASTFTRKAAGEILSRVLVRLAEAALDEEKAAELAEHAALAAGEPVELDTDRCLALLRDLVRRLHRLNIGTLDAFFIRGAQAFAHEIGLPPAWSIADEPTARRALSEALQEVLRQGDPGTTVELVRLAQRGQAGRSVHDHLLGRLDVLHAIHHQLDPAVPDPWSLYPGLARDEHGANSQGGGKAEAQGGGGAGAPGEAGAGSPDASNPARAMRERLADRIASLEAPRNASGSPNKNWAKALASAAEAIRAGDWEAFVAQTLTQRIIHGEEEYSRLQVPDDVADVYEEAVEEAVRVIGRRLNAEAGALGRLVALFDSALERVQRREGAYRFGDVTRLLGGSSPLGTRPDLNYRLDAGMRHLLLDEFQDTSVPQWSALRPVADALLGTADAVTTDAGSEANRAAIIVADPKQSIYGWRGAEPSLVYDVGRRYGLDDDVLAMSWRSSQVVLDAVNQVFEGIETSEVLDEPGRETAADWACAFAPHRAARDLPGHVRILVGPDDETRGQHRPLLLARAARLVRELREEAPGFGIGVLTRQNRAVAHLIHELKRLGVEASEEGGNPLTDSAAVVSVLALLRLADHPDDRIARYHVARTPVGAMVDFSDATDDLAARRLAHRIRERLLVDGYGDTLARWADALTRACAPRDARRLRQLVELAFRYDARATLRPMDFVRWVEAERVEDPTAADVRVMTIHQSKGLEFDIVVLPELDVPFFRGGGEEALPYREAPTGPYTRVFPYVSSGIRPLFPEIEEAFLQHRAAVLRDGLSALYVAMTRARHELHIVLKPDGKSGPGTAMTPARIVREALAPGAPADPDDVLYVSGDPGWKAKAEAKAKAKAKGVVEEGGAVVEEGGAVVGRSAPLLRAQPRRLRMLPHRAPSGLGRGTRVDLAERLRIDTAPSLERGSVIHAWCERIEWLDDALPGGGLPAAETMRRDAARLAPRMSAGEVDELIARFREWTTHPEIRAALRREAYPAAARLERELPFVYRSGDAILEGIIDRLVVWNDGAEVIDFKSDAVEPGDEARLQELVNIYAPQLEAYREAVAGNFGLPEEAVRAKLMFLRAGSVRGVDAPQRPTPNA